MKVEINSGKGKKYCTFMYQKMVFALADKKVRFPHSSLSLKNTFFSSCHQVASISYVSFIRCQQHLTNCISHMTLDTDNIPHRPAKMDSP